MTPTLRNSAGAQDGQPGGLVTLVEYPEAPPKTVSGSRHGGPARVDSLRFSVSRGGIGGYTSRLERTTFVPSVCHGQPTVGGLRYTVESGLELLSAGMSIDDALADYPDLNREDILAALEFGARAAGRRRVVPLSAA